MNFDLFNALSTLVTIVITIGGGYLINFLRQKISSQKLSTYYSLAKQVVMFIEQTNPDLINEQKKELAISKLLELTHNKITSEQAETLIESAIYEIKKLINTNLK